MTDQAGIMLMLVLLGSIFVVACSNEGGILNEILKEMSTMKQAIKDVQEIQERQNNFVGFSVKSDVDVFTAKGETVIYNTVDLDTSSSYNVNTGEFRCSFSGYYQFTVTTHSFHDEHTSMLLVKRDTASNKSYYVGAFADQSGHDQGAIAYVVHCAEGDHVFVEQGYTDGGTMSGYTSYYGGVLNAFSGFLIQLDL